MSAVPSFLRLLGRELGQVPKRLPQIAKELPGILGRLREQSQGQAAAFRELDRIVPQARQIFSKVTHGLPLGIEPPIERAVEIAKRAIKGIWNTPTDELTIRDMVKAFDADHNYASLAGRTMRMSVRNELIQAGTAPNDLNRVLEIIPRAIQQEAGAMSKLTAGQRKVAEKIGVAFRDLGLVAQEEGLLSHMLENYIPQMWKIKKPGQKRRLLEAATQAFTTAKVSPFSLARKIPSIAKGEKIGLDLRVKNVDEMFEAWINSFARAHANRRTADALRKINVEGTGLKGVATKSEITAAAKLLDDPSIFDQYVRIESRALQQYQFSGKLKGNKIRMSPEDVFVHEDIAPYVKTMFEDPVSSKALGSLQVVNAFTKKMMVSLSLFHAWALTESNIALAGWRGIGHLPRRTDLGNRLFANVDDLLEMGIRNGLELGPLDDATARIVQESIESVARSGPGSKLAAKFPILGQVGRGVRKVNQLWDRGMWDYYHRGGKINTFAEMYHALLRRFPERAASEAGRNLLAEEAARITNAGFGGLNWRRLMVSKNMKNALRLGLFAPDWTGSNLLIAYPVVANTGLRVTREFLLVYELYQA